jgi:hypothetical protein
MIGSDLFGIWGGAGVLAWTEFLSSFSTVVSKNRISMIGLGCNVLPFEY